MVKKLFNLLFRPIIGYKSVSELNYIHNQLIKSYKEMDYQQYLLTDHWKRTRAEALKAARYSCQLCGAKNVQLNVHHKTYERRGCESQEDLIVLCRDCHKRFHGK